MGMTQFIILSPELIIHVGDSAEMGCVFQSTEEKLVTKVVWMFSSEEHDKVTRRKPHGVVEAHGWGQDRAGRGESVLRYRRWVVLQKFQLWNLSGLPPSSATWLGSFGFLVGNRIQRVKKKMAVMMLIF
jgi:hypothetical protein